VITLEEEYKNVRLGLDFISVLKIEAIRHKMSVLDYSKYFAEQYRAKVNGKMTKKLTSGDDIFICYLDDNGEVKRHGAEFLSEENGTVRFLAGKNIVVIPIARLLKIKSEILSTE
jgi:hypothetical protein